MSNSVGFSPNSWEQRCLSQLDDPTVWKRLNREMPIMDERLPASVVKLIFWFNFGVFSLAGLVVAGMVGAALANTPSEIFRSDNLIPEIALGAAFGLLFGGYSAGLYRRSWNRRSRSFHN